MSYTLILVTGFLASFHCALMFSGFILAYSVKKGEAVEGLWRKHLLFNAGRLTSFTLMGAFLGALGSFFTMSPVFNAWITIAAAVVMVLYGLSMLEVAWLRRLNNLSPRWLYQMTKRQAGEDGKSRFGAFQPAAMGVLTTLIPCGPIQAIQILALGSGSMFEGAVIMFLVSLATAPVLMGLGGAITRMAGSLRQTMIRWAAVAIFIFALTTLDRGLVLAGSPITVIPQLNIGKTLAIALQSNGVNGDNGENADVAGVSVVNGAQELLLVAERGYTPDTLTVKKGTPVRLTVEYRERATCQKQFLIPAFAVNETLPDYGSKVVEFTPTKTGTFPFTCGMGMYRGTLIVEN